MRITTILGSPKLDGNTATVLGMFEELTSKGHEIDRVNITEHRVAGCNGCLECRKSPDDIACVQDDDAEPIFERMIQADVVVYASPLYCWGFSSQIKALIDRHVCLVSGYGTPEHRYLIEGKKTALLVTCAGPVDNNTEFIQGIFDKLNEYTMSEVAGKYIVPFCTIPGEIGDDAKEIVAGMAKDLVLI